MPNASRPGTIYQTNRWRTVIRRQVLERAGYRCQSCRKPGKEIGGPVTLTVAHVIPARKAPHLAEALHNLKALCRSCHGREDGGRRYS